ncbi:MAG: tRNA uridine(34) 5-carboxymethylaminomethyl modification radical SAM/GNAT enzyme Elp3 [bacterium]|nr:tRNA uridine(34) 5-carboxymethylaminomethyl modification radical SAM/GNAT enzyme Elp3 [bacterium]
MSKQLRPPKSLVSGIMADWLALEILSVKGLDTATRRRLDKTVYRFPKASELLEAYRATKIKRKEAEKLLRIKSVRTDSGVAPVTVLTKSYPCPGKCVYCPLEARMPKSYLSSEPAAARALSLKFDPYDQVYKRVQMMELNGHEAKKIELIVKGGTWSAYPWSYRRWFIKRCFDAANHLGRKDKPRYGNLASAQKANESAGYRIIGLTIETRPDWLNEKEIMRLRELGCTRVELGVQVIDDEILTLIKRGHNVDAVARATAMLKSAGFKVDYHFMPGLPGSTVEKDVAMFKQLFSDPRFCPDMVKLYPCVVMPASELATWKNFKPLEGDALINALIQMKSVIPRYCRLSRLIRDFPAQEIKEGNKVTNLRDTIKERMKAQGLVCQCLRCREAGHRPIMDPKTKIKLFSDVYSNAGGTEYFLSMEDEKRSTVFSFLRLRLPGSGQSILPELKGSAIVRELHTYGEALNIGGVGKDAVQHKGLGQKLMKEAERIAKEHDFSYLSVISGVGVRGYYRKLGYRLCGTYMRKRLA